MWSRDEGLLKHVVMDQVVKKRTKTPYKVAFPEFNSVVVTLSISISRAQEPDLGEKGQGSH